MVRNVGLGALSFISMVGLAGCSCNYNSGNTYNERREPTKVIIQEKIIIKEVPAPSSTVPYSGNKQWSEPTDTPPHPEGQPNHPVPNTNQYDHPRGQDPRFRR